MNSAKEQDTRLAFGNQLNLFTLMITYPKGNVKEKECFSKAHTHTQNKTQTNLEINLTKEVNDLYAETYKKY